MHRSPLKDALAFFRPRFWRLLTRTVQLKRIYRNDKEGDYRKYLGHFYDPEYNPYWQGIPDKWAAIRPQMVSLAGLQPGEKVLDLATGVGFQAATFADFGCRTTGIDLFYDRVQAGNRRTHGAPLDWVVGDGCRIPAKEGAFDVVSVSLALHDMPQDVVIQVLGEIHRVARRKVLIVEPRPPGNRLLRNLYILFARIFDESMFMREYLSWDIVEILRGQSLKVERSVSCFYNLLVIYVCVPDPKSQSIN